MVNMYLYRLYNKNKEVIYIGQTTNSVELRIKRHFSNYNKYKLDRLWKTEIKYYDYIELNTKSELDIYEIYYINKHKPIYNSQYKDNGKLTNRLKQLPELPFKNIDSIDGFIDIDYYAKRFKERKIKLLTEQINSKSNQNKYMLKAVNDLPQIVNEILNIINNQPGINKHRDKLIIKFIVYYGLKISDLVNLDLDDVDEQNKTLRVNNKIFNLSDDLINDYRKYLLERNNIDRVATISLFNGRNPVNALFVSRHKRRISVRTIQLLFNDYSDKLGKEITPESLRRIFIKSLINKTTDLSLLTDVTGLTPHRITEIYFEKAVN